MFKGKTQLSAHWKYVYYVRARMHAYICVSDEGEGCGEELHLCLCELYTVCVNVCVRACVRVCGCIYTCVRV